MLSVIRRLFTVASAISLLLCIGWVLLWTVSLQRIDQIDKYDGSYHYYRVTSSAGHFELVYYDGSRLRKTRTASATPWQHSSFTDPLWVNRHEFAFEWREPPVPAGTGHSHGPVGRETLLQFPDWIAALFFGVLPAGWFLAHRRRMNRHRFAGVRCPTCGYDLRATKSRCPECGTVIKAMSAG